MRFSSKPLLTVKLDQSVLFLRKSEVSSPSNTNIRGTITLTLVKAQYVESITIQLKSKLSSGDLPVEKTILKECKLEFDTWIESGTTDWNFSFRIDGDTDPSYSSRILDRDVLKLEYQVIALLDTNARSKPVSLELISLSSNFTDLFQSRKLESSLGVTKLVLSSPDLSISSICSLSISISTPPPSSYIKAITSRLLQTVEMVGREPKTTSNLLFYVDGTNFNSSDSPDSLDSLDRGRNPGPALFIKRMVEFDGSKPFRFDRTFRIPSHLLINPTSATDSTSIIKASHQIVTEIHYGLAPSPNVDIFTKLSCQFVTKVSIASCFAHLDLEIPPPYSRKELLIISKKPVEKLCRCKSSLAEMVASYREAIGELEILKN